MHELIEQLFTAFVLKVGTNIRNEFGTRAIFVRKSLASYGSVRMYDHVPSIGIPQI